MKNKTYLLNTFLAAVVGIYLLGCLFVRAFFPAVILPKANVPDLVLLGLVALVLDHYLAAGAKRCYICIPIFAALTYGLLPYAAGMVDVMYALKLALAGAVTFTVTTWQRVLSGAGSAFPCCPPSPSVCCPGQRVSPALWRR